MFLLSHLAFLGFLGGVALFVVTTRVGLTTALNASVAAFGAFYALWSVGFTWLFSSPDAPEWVYHVSTVGMFGLPVASVFITLSLGRLPLALKRAAAAWATLGALAIVGWSLSRHRFFPDLLAWSLDSTPLLPFERWFPAGVFAVNGLSFAVGFVGLLRARAAQSSVRLQRQVTLVLVQLSVGLGAFVSASLAELVWSWSPWAMVTLLYSLFLNFYLIGKYRYLRFDLPTLGPEIIESLHEAVVLLAPDGTILKANPAALSVLAPVGDLRGQPWVEFFIQPAVAQAQLDAALASGEPQSLVGVGLKAGTASVWISAHRDAFSDLIGFVAVVDRSDAFDAASQRFGLTPREKEVATLLIQGHSVRQMAEDLFVSEATIKTHLIRLYRKSGARNRVTFLQNILQPK